ncbi:MAG: FkbM family methyltransferase [Candidatus Omnitrophica bacterium]|nr:FkbM family methyltransferase [Candidatus Omnitrophota bacterium]
MALRTNILFYLLIRELSPSFVCDIGSRDGYNSIRFRRFSPGSKVLAFEANPYNAKRMMEDPEILSCNIEVVNKAVSNKSGEAAFRVERAEDITTASGISSLRERVDGSSGIEDMRVPISGLKLWPWIKLRFGSMWKALAMRC